METLNKLLGILVVFLCQNMVAMEENNSYSTEDFTRSTLISAAKSIEESFNTACDAAEGSVFPTIFYIIDRNDHTSWEAIINYGYKKNKFTSADAMWVLQEFSKPEKLMEDGPQLVFDKFIMNSFENNHKTQIIEGLLKERSIAIKDEWYSQWTPVSFFNEKRSPLIEIIELSASSPSALKAFQTIFSHLSMKIIEEDLLVSREEKTMEKESYWSWKYEERAYTVIEWLIREKGSLLTKNSHYAAAATYLLNRKLRVPGFINDKWFDLLTALKMNHIIDDNLFKAGALRYRKNEK